MDEGNTAGQWSAKFGLRMTIVHPEDVQTSAEESDRYEIVADPLALEALRSQWDALYQRAAQPYFSQSFPWCWTSWQIVGKPRGRCLHCLVARRNGRVVLIWPFVVHRAGPWSLARPLGPETSEYSDVLVEEGPQADARIAAAWQVLRRTCRCDIIALPLVRSTSKLHQTLSVQATPAFFETDPTSYVSRANFDTWEAYERSLGSDTRRKIARTRRRLKEKGELVFEPVVEPDQCEGVIDWILRQKQERLVETRLKNPWLHTPEYRSFLAAMASAPPAPSGRLIISVLRLDGAVIAADIARVDKTRIEGINKVFDPDFGPYGLGQMLQEDCLKWAFAQGRDFDFRLGSETYKRHWANGTCDVVSYEFANSAWGRTYVSYRNVQRRVSLLRYKIPPKWRRKIKNALGRGRTKT